MKRWDGKRGRQGKLGKEGMEAGGGGLGKKARVAYRGENCLSGGAVL